jgi:hypothetical protein
MLHVRFRTNSAIAAATREPLEIERGLGNRAGLQGGAERNRRGTGACHAIEPTRALWS